MKIEEKIYLGRKMNPELAPKGFHTLFPEPKDLSYIYGQGRSRTQKCEDPMSNETQGISLFVSLRK